MERCSQPEWKCPSTRGRQEGAKIAELAQRSTKRQDKGTSCSWGDSPQHLEERRNSNDNRNCAQVLKISNSLSTSQSQLFHNFHISLSHVRLSAFHRVFELIDFNHFGPRNILSLVDRSVHQELLQKENPGRHRQSQQLVKSAMPSQAITDGGGRWGGWTKHPALG